MKAILVPLFLIFISTSYALGVPHRFGKQISIHSLHLEKISSLGSALKGLIQLADVQELDPVIEVIKDVTEELKALLGSNKDNLALLTDTHDSDAYHTKNLIEDLENFLQSTHDALVDAERRETGLEGDIESNVDAINQAHQDINTQNNKRAQTESDNKAHIANIHEALKALEEAEDILEQIRSQDLTAGGAFIETQKKKFSRTLSLVQKKLSKSKLKISPTDVYIKELVQIAQEVEAQATINGELLDQIFVLVQNFKASLADEAKETQASDDQDAANTANALELLNQIIDTQQNALESNQAQLAAVKGQIANLESSITTIEANLENAKNNLELIESNFAEQSQILEGYIQRLELDLDVLQRALVFVQTEAASLETSSDSEESEESEDVESEGAEVDATVQVDVPEPAHEDEEDEDLSALEPLFADVE